MFVCERRASGVGVETVRDPGRRARRGRAERRVTRRGDRSPPTNREISSQGWENFPQCDESSAGRRTARRAALQLSNKGESHQCDPALMLTTFGLSSPRKPLPIYHRTSRPKRTRFVERPSRTSARARSASRRRRHTLRHTPPLSLSASLFPASVPAARHSDCIPANARNFSSATNVITVCGPSRT